MFEEYFDHRQISIHDTIFFTTGRMQIKFSGSERGADWRKNTLFCEESMKFGMVIPKTTKTIFGIRPKNVCCIRVRHGVQCVFA